MGKKKINKSRRLIGSNIRYRSQGSDIHHSTHESEIMSTNEGITTGIIDQIEKYLSSVYSIKRNKVLGRLFISRKNDNDFKIVDDSTYNSLIRELNKKGIKANTHILGIILNSDYVPDYDPFVEYYKNLPPWDNHDHIGDLIRTIKVNTPELFDECFRKWLVV
jgi:hypothetical protein